VTYGAASLSINNGSKSINQPVPQELRHNFVSQLISGAVWRSGWSNVQADKRRYLS